MRAVPHAGSSRCRLSRAISVLLAVVLAAPTVLGDGCGPHPEPRAVARAATAAGVPLSGGGPPFDESGYWTVADRLQAKLDPLWDERRGIYVPGSGGVDALVNAGVLFTHSVA